MAFALLSRRGRTAADSYQLKSAMRKAEPDGVGCRAHRNMYRRADDCRRYRGGIDTAENSVAEWK